MASWRDQLFLEGKGSFRGQKFFVRSASTTTGRRTVTHEFPGRDIPYVEDLGRATRKYQLECYVLGDNYINDRNRLRKAFETRGAGTLIHPYWGTFDATVEGPVQILETTDEGGMARFSLAIVETPLPPKPVKKDTAKGVDTAATKTTSAVGAAFEAAFTTAGYITDVVTAAVATVNAVTTTINQVNGKIKAAMNLIDSVGDAITDISNTAAALVALPGQLVEEMKSVVGDVIASVNTISDSFTDYFDDDEALTSSAGAPSMSPSGATPASGDMRSKLLLSASDALFVTGDDWAPVPTTTTQRIQQAANQAAMIQLTKTLTTAETCRAASLMEYTSADSATATRDVMVDQIDTLCDTADDETYMSLTALRSAIVEHLDTVSANLPHSADFTPTATIPALVLAQNLYGDSTWEQDLIDRNNVQNPCLVPGNVTIKVLKDV